jgi:hypothetical protein
MSWKINMKRFRTLFIAVCLFYGVIPAMSAPQNCTVGAATIFFGNGVDVSADGAIASMLDLANTVGPAIDSSNAYDPSCFRYKLSYDTTFVDPNTDCKDFFNMPWPGKCGDALNIFVQAGLIASAQVVSQPGFANQLSTYLFNPAGAPSWLLDAFRRIVQKAYVLQPDVNTHVNDYNNEIKNGNAVVVVAHSQGNLYANQEYPLIQPAPSTSNPKNFSIVSVATPANSVAGQMCPQCLYVTLVNDVITNVPGSLQPNVDNIGQPGGDPCAQSQTQCHFFDSSYLAGIHSGPAIANYVVDELPLPLGILKTGSGSGTVTSTPAGLNCGSVCIFSFNLGAPVTFTATPDSNSTFGGWSGFCTLSGATSGNSITFMPSNSLLTFGGDCTATFNMSGNIKGSIQSITCQRVPGAFPPYSAWTVVGTIQGPPLAGFYLNYQDSGMGNPPAPIQFRSCSPFTPLQLGPYTGALCQNQTGMFSTANFTVGPYRSWDVTSTVTVSLYGNSVLQQTAAVTCQ